LVDWEFWEAPVSCIEEGTLARNPTAAAASTTPKMSATARPRTGEGALGLSIAYLAMVCKAVD
jgi:hypothetical protein